MIFLFFISSVPAARGAEETPRLIVEGFQETMLAVMKEAKTLGFRGRYERLAPAIARAFDLPLMVRIAIGSYWNLTSAEQRTRLATAFERMSVSTLATLITGYSGERFETIGEGPGEL